MGIDVKYSTTATASGGGRDGKVNLADGTLALRLAVPREFGGPGGDGANPEQLFALGYSACFLSALRFYGGSLKFKISEEATVSATIGIGPRSEGGFGLTARLDVYLPGMDAQDSRVLVDGAHATCPYSNALRGNVDVDIQIRS
jgi:osmotically inducible protein OsmC